MKRIWFVFFLLVSLVLVGCSVTIKYDTASDLVHSNLMSDSTSSQSSVSSSSQPSDSTSSQPSDSTSSQADVSRSSQADNSVANSSVASVKSEQESSKANVSSAAKVADNFILYDDISGKVILSCYVEMTETTVGKLTLQVLQQNKLPYEKVGSGKGIYFKSIAGLSESTKDGKMTGWCFYVKKAGQFDYIKPSIGSGRYTVTTGDVVKWMYVKDGAGLE